MSIIQHVSALRRIDSQDRMTRTCLISDNGKAQRVYRPSQLQQRLSLCQGIIFAITLIYCDGPKVDLTIKV